jgi:hypothetical protein
MTRQDFLTPLRKVPVVMMARMVVVMMMMMMILEIDRIDQYREGRKVVGRETNNRLVKKQGNFKTEGEKDQLTSPRTANKPRHQDTKWGCFFGILFRLEWFDTPLSSWSPLLQTKMSPAQWSGRLVHIKSCARV